MKSRGARRFRGRRPGGFSPSPSPNRYTKPSSRANTQDRENQTTLQSDPQGDTGARSTRARSSGTQQSPAASGSQSFASILRRERGTLLGAQLAAAIRKNRRASSRRSASPSEQSPTASEDQSLDSLLHRERHTLLGSQLAAALRKQREAGGQKQCVTAAKSQEESPRRGGSSAEGGGTDSEAASGAHSTDAPNCKQAVATLSIRQ